MDGIDIKKLRAVTFVGHSGCGKTSIIDSLLHKTGVNSRLGKVSDGTSLCDYDPMEISRKISLSAKFLHSRWQDNFLFFLDTPGYADFIIEVYSALRAADAAVLVVDAAGGVEVGTDRSWGLIDEHNLPCFIFVNKLDKENTDFAKTVADIQESFGKNCAPLYYPVGAQAQAGFSQIISLIDKTAWDKLSVEDKAAAEKMRGALIDSVAETDDQLLEKYLGGEEPTPQDITKGIRNAVIKRNLIPIICGAAIKEIGTTELLETLINFAPDPSEGPQITFIEPGKEEEKTLAVSSDSPFSAFVFKNISDPYVGNLTLFRVYGGKLAANTEFFNVNKQVKERIGQLYLMEGKEQKPVNTVTAGDIACVAKLKDTTAGDSLADAKHPMLFKPLKKMEPVISFSLKPKTRQDEEKISDALHKLAAEDRGLLVSIDPQTKELIISGMGDAHLEIIIQRLKQRYHVDVEVGMPKVPYKETIKKKVQVQGKYKRQSGGRGQYGDVWLELEPLPRGSNFEFINKIFGGAVPRQYIPSVEKGVKNAMLEGVVAGYPVVDIRVTIYDGSYHDVDSSDMAFQIAAALAFKKGVHEANAVILEPVMEINVVVPEEFTGAVNGDLNSRRGRIMGIEPGAKSHMVKAMVPMAELLKYATDLRSLTQGRGSYTMHFDHYADVPAKIAEKVISQGKPAQIEI